MSLDSKILQILDSSACLSKRQMTGYLQKNLYAEELRAVELHLSECPFCSDALDGLEQEIKAITLLNDLKQPNLPPPPKESKVEAVLDKVAKSVTLKTTNPKADIAPKPEPALVSKEVDTAAPHNGSSTSTHQQRFNWFKPIAVAAGLVLAIIAGWYWFNNQEAEQPKLAQRSTPPPAPASEQHSVSESNELTEPAISSPATDSVHSAVATNAPSLPSKDTVRPVVVAVEHTPAIKATIDTAPAVAKQVEASKPVDEGATAKRSAAAPKAAVAEKAEVAESVVPAMTDALKAKPRQDANMSDYEIAIELFKQGQYGSALLYFRTAQRNSGDPKHYDATYFSGMCYKATGKKKKAIQMFKKLVDEGAPQAAAAQKQLRLLEAEE